MKRFALRGSMLVASALAAVSLSACASSDPTAGLSSWRAVETELGYGSRSTTTEAAEAPPDVAADASLDDLVRYALHHNPGLEASFQQWKAALERIPQVRSLPDPRLSYTWFVQRAEMRQSASLTQEFPWWGKLDLDAQMAAEAAAAEEQRFHVRRLEVIARVKQAWAEYVYAGRAAAVIEQNLKLVRSAEESVRIRYAAGGSMQTDLIRAQIEVDRFDNELATMRAMVSPAGARLNAALGRASTASLPPPGAFGGDAVLPADGELVVQLRRQNPQLLAISHEMAEQRIGVRRARKEDLPDPMVGIEYGDMAEAGMEDEVGLMISANLPIHRERRDAAVRERLAKFNAALRERLDRQNMLEEELNMALFRYRDAERRIELFGTRLLGKARQAVETSDASYRSRGSSLTDLLVMRRDLLELELAHERALADRFQQRAVIEQVSGGVGQSSGEGTHP